MGVGILFVPVLGAESVLSVLGAEFVLSVLGDKSVLSFLGAESVLSVPPRRRLWEDCSQRHKVNQDRAAQVIEFPPSQP